MRRACVLSEELAGCPPVVHSAARTVRRRRCDGGPGVSDQHRRPLSGLGPGSCSACCLGLQPAAAACAPADRAAGVVRSHWWALLSALISGLSCWPGCSECVVRCFFPGFSLLCQCVCVTP
eukprot:747658-Hanusia_phi.AAC.2